MTEYRYLDPEDPMSYCNACLGSTDPDYQVYNFAVSGLLLAAVGVVGLFGNVLVIRVYLSREQRTCSISIYLAALAASDFWLIITAMFLFVLEAWRHHNYPLLAWMYVTGAPVVFPLAAVFQTSSVYFCVAAAVDCFITVVLPSSVKQLYCTPRRAKVTVLCIMVFCLLYNIPHAFEIEKVACISPAGAPGWQICPTEIRRDPAYYTIYYTYMYTTFLAVGPLLLLILLNICVVYTVVTKTSESDEESDTVSLILVVFFFIFCNFTALLVNFLELIFHDKLGDLLVYLVDLSNLLVVINATANFFCYLCFGASFRRTLCSQLCKRKQRESPLIWQLNGNGIAPESRTLL